MTTNRLLTDKDREFLAPTIQLMWDTCPDMMKRKIPRANVQQGFVLNQVLKLVRYKKDATILSVGCFEDTAYETLRKLKYNITGIDPEINSDLRNFVEGCKEKFDIAFSTSVLEHVEDDEQFIRDMCFLLDSGGYGILTMDFNNSYRTGDKLPYSDLRFYTKHDLEFRLTRVLTENNCDLVDVPDWSGEPEFTHDGCVYSFSTFVFRKKG